MASGVSPASTSKNSGRASGGGETPTERVKVRGTCATSRVNGRRETISLADCRMPHRLFYLDFGID